MLHYERNLFFLLNGSDSVILDRLMFIVSVTNIWFPLYLFVILLLFYKTPKKVAAFTLFIFIMLIVFCDQFSSGLIKPIFERLRPGNHPDFMEYTQLVFGRRGGGYAFISGHATNSAGFAVLLSLVFKNRWLTLTVLTWAGLISYSRVYLGMHYVSDVIGGIIAGTAIAFAVYYGFIYLRKKIFKLEAPEKTPIYSERHGRIMFIAFAAYFAFVLLFSYVLAPMSYSFGW